MTKVLIAIILMINSSAYAKEVLLDRIVAVVNSDIITLSDTKDYERSLKMRRGKMSEEEYQTLSTSPKAVLDKIIESKIILQYLKDNGMESDKDEIDSLIKRRMKTVGMNVKDLEKELRDNGQTMDDLRNELEVEQGKARIFERDLKRKISVSEKDYENFFEHEFKQPVNVSEYKIKHILVKDPATAEKIYQELKKNKSFDDLAYKYSEDAGTKNNGGDLGYMSSNSLLPEMQKAVENMTVGDIKGPIKTKLGYHIIKLEAFRTQKNPEYAKNKENIERVLVEKDFQRQLSLWLDDRKEEYYVRTYM